MTGIIHIISPRKWPNFPLGIIYLTYLAILFIIVYCYSQYIIVYIYIYIFIYLLVSMHDILVNIVVVTMVYPRWYFLYNSR